MRPLQMIFAIVFWLLAPLGFAQTVGGVWEDSGSFTGPNADSQQGSVLVNAGDLDGDGLDDLLIGDPSKAREKLGWEPKVKFKELVKIMVEADLKELEENK